MKRGSRRIAVCLAAILVQGVLAEEDKPKWFGQDYKSPQSWGFFCQGEGDTEDKALGSARAQCAAKMCQLFGVEVDYKSTSKETLKDTSLDSVIVERCPKVRVVGRVEKKKNVSCEESKCLAFVEQFYPKTEYDKEFKRLNEPAISKTLERTIIVREGNDTFKDPKACKVVLQEYFEIRGERSVDKSRRIGSLKKAVSECVSLDYRDANLQTELNGYLSRSLMSRTQAAALDLGKALLANNSIEKRLEAFLAFESRSLEAEKNTPKLRALIEKLYDRLYYRDSYLADKGRWSLSDHSMSTVNPYIEELKTCKAQGVLLRNWPGAFSDSLTVCIKRPVNPGEDCSTVTKTMVRFGFIGCVCNLGMASASGQCVQVLAQYLDEICPGQVTAECFKSFGRYSAERLKMDIKLPAGE